MTISHSPAKNKLTKALSNFAYIQLLKIQSSSALEMIKKLDAFESAKGKEKTTMPQKNTNQQAQVVAIDKGQLNRLKNLDVISFNANAEKFFVELTKKFIVEEGPQSVGAIVAEGAFELDISIETAKRYLLKHTARRAEFKISDKMVHSRD